MPREGSVLLDNEYVCADLQRPFETEKNYDLVMSLEVAEHLEPDSTEVFLESIARNAKDLILFSMAGPGQPGERHINCLDMQMVLRHWQALGWYPDVRETLAVRALSTLSWFKRNLLVLRPKEALSPDLSMHDPLLRIANYSYKWYGQYAGIRREAFQEQLPRPRFGYGRSIAIQN